MKENNKKLFEYVLYLFLIMPFFQVPFLNNVSSLCSSIYKIWQIMSAIIIIILIIKNAKYSKIINSILAYSVVLLISTIINNGEVVRCILILLHVLVLSLIIDYGIRNKLKIFLDSIEFFLSILIYINFITILMFPNGMYLSNNGYFSNWFLGFKNIHILYMLPAILCSCLNSYFDKNKLSKRSILLIFISFISIIKVNSSTGIVGLLTFCITYFLYSITKNTKIFNIMTYLIIYLSAFIGIVILKIQNLFSFFIVDILHKDLTFTGRTVIWDYVLGFIKSKKFLGYGVENNLVRLNKTSIYQSYHAHNQILEIIYKSGIIGIIIFSIMVYRSFKELLKLKQTKQAVIISLILFSYFILTLTEAYDLEYIIFIFVIAYNVKYFIKEETCKI